MTARSAAAGRPGGIGAASRASIPGVRGTAYSITLISLPLMPDLLLSGQDLAKAFGAAPLFEGLSFGIFEGDHIGLVGPNGSGKSTLLKMLAGLEPPSARTRSVRKRLRIGYVAQDPVFAPETTVGS